jgi:hypothetical protein
VLAGLFALTLGCSQKRPPVVAKTPVIVIDDWYNVETAKMACGARAEMAKTVPSVVCTADPAPSVRDFEAQLATSFATDASCHGIVLVGYGQTKMAVSKDNEVGDWELAQRSLKDEGKADWRLQLTFFVGETSHHWRLETLHSPSSPREAVGEGDAQQIARAACVFLKQPGARIVE